MNRQLAVAGAFFVGAIALLCMAIIPTGDDAQLECDSVVDLGQVPAGQQQTVRLRLANPTSFSVVVVRLHATCSCTDARVGSQVIAAGEATTLSVNINVGMGPVSSSVIVYYQVRGLSVIKSVEVSIRGEGVASPVVVAV